MTDRAIFPSNRAEPRLFSVLPELREKVPFCALAHVPTPVVRCDAIAGYLGRDDVLMKRDDLISPLFGGNKVRRYEHVLADATERGATSLVTAGGLASTQVMATALFGKALGFQVHAVLFDQPMTSFAKAAMLASATAGARLVYGGGYLRTAVRTFRLTRSLPRSYVILPGAANPLANLGYVDAMIELADQVERGELPRPDVIVLPTGSSGTLAALAIGASFLGWDTTILGVRITARIVCNRVTIRFIAHGTEKWLRKRSPTFARRARRSLRFSLAHDAVGAGYGHPTPEAIEGVRQMEILTGQPGEVTYSGKALAALRRITRDRANRNKTILFWNTLSTPRPPIDPSARSRLPPELARLLDDDVPV